MHSYDHLKDESHQLKDILDWILKEPTHLNYWNAYKRIHKLNLAATNIPQEKKIKIALLSSSTVNLLGVYLDIKSRLVGLYPEIYIGLFNQFKQDILDTESNLYAFSPDIVILAVQAEALLSDDFYAQLTTSAQPEQQQQEIIDQLHELLAILAGRTHALIVVNNFIVPYFTPLGIIENKVNRGMKSFFYMVNQQLADQYRDSNQIYIFDLEGVASKHGKARCLNYEMYYRGAFAFSESFLPVVTEEYMGYVKALKNLTRKCIVVDLDNVLWGGIIGEDGFDGIKLGLDAPGNAYMDFQRLLLGYYHRGIILAINSKNNYEDAIKVIRDHPYMVLREQHFAAMRINWQDKVHNIMELAEELNIGLDSIAFVDDNSREREQMKQALPQVLVVNLPSSPFRYKQTFESLNDFNILVLTEEDKQRGKMYYARKMREQLKESMISLDTFLRSLEMKIVIKHGDSFTFPRIASLLNKTNQFNLTTHRYSEEEIRKMGEDHEKFNIYSLQVIDKFGDEGIVGVAIIRKRPKEWIIDSFLMSCRVIGRQVETALLAKIVADAKQVGIPTVIGEYIPTQKNALVQHFYSDSGFELLVQERNRSTWRLDLTRSTVKTPDWLEGEDAYHEQ